MSRTAAASTMFLMTNFLIALSFGTQRAQLVQRTGFTWPRPCFARPPFLRLHVWKNKRNQNPIITNGGYHYFFLFFSPIFYFTFQLFKFGSPFLMLLKIDCRKSEVMLPKPKPTFISQFFYIDKQIKRKENWRKKIDKLWRNLMMKIGAFFRRFVWKAVAEKRVVWHVRFCQHRNIKREKKMWKIKLKLSFHEFELRPRDLPCGKIYNCLIFTILKKRLSPADTKFWRLDRERVR